MSYFFQKIFIGVSVSYACHLSVSVLLRMSIWTWKWLIPFSNFPQCLLCGYFVNSYLYYSWNPCHWIWGVDGFSLVVIHCHYKQFPCESFYDAILCYVYILPCYWFLHKYIDHFSKLLSLTNHSGNLSYIVSLSMII